MKWTNWRIVEINIGEAIEELQRLHGDVAKAKSASSKRAALEVMLGHVYHHLNVAWNARSASTKRYAKMSARDFRRWSRFPTDLWVIGMSTDEPMPNRTGRRLRARPKRPGTSGPKL